MFDPRFYTKAECCGSGWAVLDPYTFSVAPLPAYPSSQDWTIGHPSLAPDQLHWEALIQHASVEKRISSTVGTVSLKVFKGDMPHVQVYNLDASGQVAPSTILDVGANYGGVAVALAKLYSYARFVVLEPNPLLCRFLLWNLRRHGLTNRVWPLCAGAAPQIGEVLMQPCHEPWIGHLVNSCMNMAMRTFNASTEASSAAVVKVGFASSGPSPARIVSLVGWLAGIALERPLGAHTRASRRPAWRWLDQSGSAETGLRRTAAIEVVS